MSEAIQLDDYIDETRIDSYLSRTVAREIASCVRTALEVAMPRSVRQGLKLPVVTGGKPGVEVSTSVCGNEAREHSNRPSKARLPLQGRDDASASAS